MEANYNLTRRQIYDLVQQGRLPAIRLRAKKPSIIGP
jgi:hypothetical protein